MDVVNGRSGKFLNKLYGKMREVMSNTENRRYTLHEAMKIVLTDHLGKMLHATDLADEVYSRNLYRKRDGNMAVSNQIRARSNKYRHMFKVLPGNMIKLIEEKDNE